MWADAYYNLDIIHPQLFPMKFYALEINVRLILNDKQFFDIVN